MINVNLLAAKGLLHDDPGAEIVVPLSGNVQILSKNTNYKVLGERKSVIEALDS